MKAEKPKSRQNNYIKYMKRFIYFVLLVFISISANAQLFVGGHLGFSYNGGSDKVGNTSVDAPSTRIFNFSPMAGYYLTPKMAVGVKLNFNSIKEETPDDETIEKTKTFGIAPFLRYHAITFNKISVFAQGGIGFSFASSKTTVNGTSTDEPKTTSVGFGMSPGISYELNEHFMLETTINILSVNYSFSTTKEGSGATEVETKRTYFILGAGLDNVVNVGAITIGAIYKF